VSFATLDPSASPLVLLADPHVDELEMYSKYLQLRGFRVAVSDNGADALMKAIAVRPDVVCASLVLAELTVPNEVVVQYRTVCLAAPTLTSMRVFHAHQA
jgi:CheY-like chemotaxis protein